MTKRVLNVCVIVFIVLFGLTACGGGGGGAGGGASIPDSYYTTHNPGGWGGGGNSGGHNSGSANGGTNVTTQGGTPLVVNSFRYQGVTCSNPPDELVRMWHDDEKTGTFYAEFFCNNEPNPRQVRVVGEQRVNARGETNYVYTFNLQYKATCHVPGGTQDIYYFQNEGIDLNAYHNGGDFGSNYASTTVWGWYENNSTGGTNRYPLSNNGHVMIPESDKGDHELYPVFQFASAPTVEWITETGVQEYGGADTYLYDYAQNTNGVKIQISQEDFPGCTVTGNIDGGTPFTLRPVSTPVPYSTHLTAGHHVITMNSSGSNNCAPQTFTKEIDVYVKPVLRIADVGTSSSESRYLYNASATSDTYRFKWYTNKLNDSGYDGTMAVTGLTAVPDVATVTNACLDGSVITDSSKATIGTHTLSGTITGNYCVQPDNKPITVEIKPVKVTVGTIEAYTSDGDSTVDLSGTIHAGSGQDSANLKSFSNTGLNKHHWITPDSHNIYLRSPSDNFDFWTDKMWDIDDGNDDDIGTVNRGSCRRSLTDLLSNTWFEAHKSGGDSGSVGDYYFSVSLSDSY